MTIPPSLAQPSVVQAAVEATDPNALSKTILDAKGDLISASAADTPIRLGVGTDGQFLAADSSTASGLAWVDDPTEVAFDAKGDLLAGTGPNAYQVLPVGTNGQVLIADSSQTTGLRWTSEQDPTAITKSIIDAKGDLIAGQADDTPVRLPVGTNDQLLIADSAQTSGLKWGRPTIALGTETSGDYVAGVTGGTGVTVTGSGGEGSAPSVAIGQAVGTGDTVAFGGLNVDSGTLYVDATNNRVGINDTTPSYALDVTGDGRFTTNLTVDGTLYANHIHGDLAGLVYFHVKNTTASTIPNGTPVYITGTVGSTQVAEIAPADASNPAKMPAIGITDGDLTANANGHAVISGDLDGQNTNAYSINQPLYVASGGGLTSTRPTGASDVIQIVGHVSRVNTNTGGIVVACGPSANTPNTISVTGNISTSAGYFSGSGSGLTNLPASALTGTISSTNIGNDSIALGTKTTGDYVQTLSAGTGVTVTGGTGEGSTPTVAIGQAVGTTSSPQFAGITATGTVSANALSSTTSVSAASASITGTTATSVLTVDSIEIDTTGATANQVLKYNGTKFAPSTGASVTISDTAPTSPSPQAGDQWYESDTGRTFIYYDNVWVEIGSTATTNVNANDLSGTTLASNVVSSSLTSVGTITNLQATSATINGWTVSQPGLVFITGTTVTSGSTTTVSFNNCFSSLYDNYRIVIDNFYTSTGNRGLNLRLRVGGVDATGSNYNNVFHGLTMAGAGSNFTGTNDYASTGVYNSSNTIGLSSCTMDVFNPNKAERTYAQVQSILYDSQWITRNGLWQHDLTTAYDGFTLLMSSTGNITQVRVRVYGYRNS